MSNPCPIGSLLVRLGPPAAFARTSGPRWAIATCQPSPVWPTISSRAARWTASTPAVAIRRASSRVSRCAADRLPGLSSKYRLHSPSHGENRGSSPLGSAMKSKAYASSSEVRPSQNQRSTKDRKALRGRLWTSCEVCAARLSGRHGEEKQTHRRPRIVP